MIKYIHLFVLILGAQLSTAQVSVTFRLDMSRLNEESLFSFDSGDRLFVRGSFNEWSGNAYELNQTPDPDIFTGTFTPGNIGDTIYYKYVIVRGPDQYFLETRPVPDNPYYGSRQLVLKKKNIILSTTPFHYDEYIRYPVVFSKEKLREDFMEFRNILESTHPALYDYTEKKVLDSLFDHNFAQINSDLNFSEFLILMTGPIAHVGCGHSSLWVPRKFWNVAPEKLFPLKLVYSGNKLLVTGSYGPEPLIPTGSEIISINNKAIKPILKRLTSLTSADGFNPSYRKEKVAQNFAVKYALAFGFTDTFKIEYLPQGKQKKALLDLQPVSKAAIDKTKTGKPELSFKEVEGKNTGILTINSFGYYGQVEMFYAFIDSVFREINAKGIGNLVLDLRGNSGGDPFCSSYLWSYLEPEPLPYFKEPYGRYDTLANPIPMADKHFTGEIYTLIDGNGFSTTGHFCGLLKYHQVGSFIGTELGSTYTCTGNATYPPLKNTGIMVGTARVRRYTAAVQGMDPMRGILPDYPVELSQKDIIEGNDPVMEFAFSLIKENK